LSDSCPEKREESRSNRTGLQPDAKCRESFPPSGDAIPPKSLALPFAIGWATRRLGTAVTNSEQKTRTRSTGKGILYCAARLSWLSGPARHAFPPRPRGAVESFLGSQGWAWFCAEPRAHPSFFEEWDSASAASGLPQTRGEAAPHSPKPSQAWIGGPSGGLVGVERTLLSAASDSCPEKREKSRSNRTEPQPDAKSRWVARPIAKRRAGPLTSFSSQKPCTHHHRLLTARRRQWNRPVCQGRGAPVSQETALEAAPAPGRRSLTTEVETGSVGVSPPPKTPGKAKNRAKSLVLEYFTLSHLESKTGPKTSS
jgi:hypothetical protein